jgi:Flp pilus assembly secretin CpaC
MDLAQVRSLTLGAELQSVRIADKSVCQAFAAGPNKLKLIGTGNGTTRLVVYAKPVPGQSEPRVRSFDVHVKEASKINTESTEVRTEILNQTIQQTFPESDVVVRRSGNELVVMGRCGSEAVAKKIVRLVRRTCLVPVKDQLRVR